MTAQNTCISIFFFIYILYKVLFYFLSEVLAILKHAIFKMNYDQ